MEHELYKAGVGYMVADKSTKDAWAGVCRFAHATMQKPDGGRILREEFKAVEAALVSDFGNSRIPGAFRSAKSTVLKALELKVPLIDSMDLPRPKTVVSKDISALKKAGTTSIPPAMPQAIPAGVDSTYITEYFRLGHLYLLGNAKTLDMKTHTLHLEKIAHDIKGL